MTGLDDDREFLVVITPRSERYDEDDDRWRTQVDGLYETLRDDVGNLQTHATPAEGTKGVLTETILALGSAGVFTASVQCVKAWLDRDKSRSLEVTWLENGEQQTVTLRGEGLDNTAVQSIAAAAAKRIGGETWQIQPTGQS